MKLSYSTIIVSALISTSCTNSKKGFNGFAKTSISSASLSDELNAAPSDQASRDAFRNSDFLSLHTRLVSGLSDAPVTIDSIKLSGLKTMVADLRQSFENLGQRYENVGKLVNASASQLNEKVPASALKAMIQNTYNNLHGVGYLAEMHEIAANYSVTPEEEVNDFSLLGPIESDKDPKKCDAIRNGFERATEEQSKADAQCEGAVFGSKSIQEDKNGDDINTINIATVCAPSISERMAAYDLLGEQGCERRLNGDEP